MSFFSSCFSKKDTTGNEPGKLYTKDAYRYLSKESIRHCHIEERKTGDNHRGKNGRITKDHIRHCHMEERNPHQFRLHSRHSEGDIRTVMETKLPSRQSLGNIMDVVDCGDYAYVGPGKTSSEPQPKEKTPSKCKSKGGECQTLDRKATKHAKRKGHQRRKSCSNILDMDDKSDKSTTPIKSILKRRPQQSSFSSADSGFESNPPLPPSAQDCYDPSSANYCSTVMAGEGYALPRRLAHTLPNHCGPPAHYQGVTFSNTLPQQRGALQPVQIDPRDLQVMYSVPQKNRKKKPDAKDPRRHSMESIISAGTLSRSFENLTECFVNNNINSISTNAVIHSSPDKSLSPCLGKQGRQGRVHRSNSVDNCLSHSTKIYDEMSTDFTTCETDSTPSSQSGHISEGAKNYINHPAMTSAAGNYINHPAMTTATGNYINHPAMTTAAGNYINHPSMTTAAGNYINHPAMTTAANNCPNKPAMTTSHSETLLCDGVSKLALHPCKDHLRQGGFCSTSGTLDRGNYTKLIMSPNLSQHSHHSQNSLHSQHSQNSLHSQHSHAPSPYTISDKISHAGSAGNLSNISYVNMPPMAELNTDTYFTLGSVSSIGSNHTYVDYDWMANYWRDVEDQNMDYQPRQYAYWTHYNKDSWYSQEEGAYVHVPHAQHGPASPGNEAVSKGMVIFLWCLLPR